MIRRRMRLTGGSHLMAANCLLTGIQLTAELCDSLCKLGGLGTDHGDSSCPQYDPDVGSEP